MSQVYLSQYARRAGIADTAAFALNAVPAPRDTWIQYNRQGKFGAEVYFRYIYPTHSFQHGDSTNAIGNWSHAEGHNTYTGFLNTYSSSILSGSITLSAEYGNITSSFRTGSYIYINDYYSDNTLGTTVAKINSTSWDNTSSYVVLDTNNIHATTSFVGSLGTFYIKDLLGNKTAGAYIAHADGRDTYAMGIGAHSKGSGSYAVGRYSHTEGDNTVALGNYQTIVGQYNLFSTSQSAFVIGDGYTRVIASGNIASSPTTGSSKFNIYSQVTPLGLFTSSIVTLVSASSSVGETFPIIGVVSKGPTEYELTIDGVLTQNYYDNIDTISVLNITRHNLLFASQSWFQVSASNVFLQGIPTTSSNYILVYDTASGQVFYTASILGGLITRDEGNLVTANTTIFNFTGSGISASLNGGAVDVYVPGGGGSIEVQDEGITVTSNTSILNFTGSGVSASLNGSIVNVYIPSGSSSSITVQDESNLVTSNASILNFTGSGVSASLNGNVTDIYIPSSSIEVRDENILVTSTATIFNLTGSGVSASLSGNVTNIYIPSKSLAITDEDNPVTSNALTINFTGSGVSASLGGDTVDVYVESTRIIAGTNITIDPPGIGTGEVTINSTATAGSGLAIAATASFNNLSVWNFTHNLNSRYVIIQALDLNHQQIIPEYIELIDTASARLTFPTFESGYAIASIGGITSSLALTASSVLTSNGGTIYSSGNNLIIDPVNNLIISGNMIPGPPYTDNTSSYNLGSSTAAWNRLYVANGSIVFVTGSNTADLKYTGTHITATKPFSGSFTGSLSGIGSSSFSGSITLTGSLNITGSTTQTGNNTLIGTTTLTGSILISGDITPTVSSSFDLGSETNPWRSVYLQSGSISIRSDIPGGPDAIISNQNGNVSITAAGFQIKSGSVIPFQIDTTGRTSLTVPVIPAGDVGAFSIVGNTSNNYQPVTSPGGMVHITGNDGQANRFNMDSFGSGSTTSFNGLIGRAARGTAAAPSQSKAGDVVLRLTSTGWRDDTGFGGTAIVGGSTTTLDFISLEDQMNNARGSAQQFYNAPIGTRNRVLSAQIDTTGITIPSSSRLFGTASWAENALTASYVRPLVQDVIITGSLKISGSLTEIGNTVLSGSLTLSSGSALRINNGFYVDGQKQFNYGQFSSTQTQSGSADTAYSMTFNTTDFSNGVSLVAGSRLTVANTGLYNIQFSSQLHTTANNQAVDFSIWFAMTGSNIANSNTDFTIERTVGGGFAVAALNFLTQIASGSYVELKYSKTTLEGQLQAKGIQSTPTRPATPSAIVTVTQIA